MKLKSILHVALLATVLSGPLLGAAFERTVLLENFTTADCINCPRGHEDIEKAIKDYPGRVAWVCHHAGYHAQHDPWQIPLNIETVKFFYPPQTLFAPAVMVDRVDFSAVMPDVISSRTPVFGVDLQSLRKTLKHQFDAEAHANVEIEPSYDPLGRQLTLIVTVTDDGQWRPSKPTLTVFLSEDGLIGYQNGKGARYQHDHVIRTALTPALGESFTFGDNLKWTTVLTTILDPEWNADNMTVTAFAADFDENDCKNCAVANTAFCAVIDNGAGMTTSSLQQHPTEYYDLLGHRLYSIPSSGIYIERTGTKAVKRAVH